MANTPTNTSPHAPSPPKGLSHSPSIFAYQTRILQRTSSTSRDGPSLAAAHRTTPGSSSLSHSSGYTSLSRLAADAGSSPPSTPIRQNVARMAAPLKDIPGSTTMGEAGSMSRSGSGRTVGMGVGHGRGSKSVDLVRGQWEAKINEAANMSGDGNTSTPRSTKRNSAFANSFQASSSMASTTSTSSPVHTPTRRISPVQTGTSAFTHHTAPTDEARPEMSYTSKASDTTPLSAALNEPPTTSSLPDSIARARPASISSYTSVLTPSSTGTSTTSAGRTQAVEDTLAQARANALKRLEARKAKAGGGGGGGASGTSEVAVSPAPAPAQVRQPENTTPRPTRSEPRSSPFGDLFAPPSAAATSATPSTSFPAPTSVLNTSAPSRSSEASSSHRYAGPPAYNPPPPASSANFGPPSTAGNDKYGSISKTDRRRLGRHLPRIASGGEGWEDEAGGHLRAPSTTERKSSSLGKSSGAPVQDAVENTPPSSVRKDTHTSANMKALPPSRPRAIDVLAPSQIANGQQASSPSVPSTPTAKRRSVQIHTTPKALGSPRAEVAGEEMKGLMSAVGALSARGTGKDEGEGVTGMSNRLRLSRSVLPPSASSATVAPAPLPSRRLMQTNWMDRQRHAIAAYEYLCHVGEAQQWIEGCLEEETGFGVTEMEEGLRDGVVLAKLARVFQGEGVVRKIWMENKHRYKQVDNIDAFLKFLRAVGMPSTFMFDPIDLYDKKNIPKVIFCIHVLSHLLAKQGLAERIGNLVGQFDFTDEQLAKTQKGLQGVAMPNFGDARKTLAKEASWAEPEEPEETEDERRDRELLECEPAIISLQRHLRGRLARSRRSRIDNQLELAEPIIIRLQARARGAMSRSALVAERDERAHLGLWATKVQAASRGIIRIRRHDARVQAIRGSERNVVALQAQVRGVLARLRRSALHNTVDKNHRGIVQLQAACRTCIARRSRTAHEQLLAQPQVAQSIASFQAVLRGRLQRQAAAQEQKVLVGQTPTFTSLQSHLRGALVRRSRRAHEQKLDDAGDYIVAIQATARGVLARRKKQVFAHEARQVVPAVTSLQALARARLAKQAHSSMQKALAKVEVAGSVGGLQAFLRTKLAKKQTTEQKKKLEFVQPDVIGFQAVARGYLARQEYREWRDYLQDPHTQGALVFLQSLVRGFLARRRLWIRTSHYRRNIDSVVKVQSVWRGRVQRQMYDRLVTGIEVDVPTVQNYMHLLDDTETDFQVQIRSENLRKEVVGLIRENQSLETEVKELDTKIALILKNKMTFEELVRARHAHHGRHDKEHGGGGGEWKDGTSRDPFSGIHLDRQSQRKLELFEHLFFTLQTKGEYLSRLLFALSRGAEEDEKDRRLVEGVTLTLFGFGHERREEYLFHKLLQMAVHEEILRSKSLEDLAEARFAIISVAAQYVKPKATPYLQEVLASHVLRVAESDVLDLSTDPAEIYRRLINEEESRTGVASPKPRNLDGNQVLQADEQSRALYIQHLQELRYLTADLLKALRETAQGLPYTVRLLAREALLALRVKYPQAVDEELTPIVARTVVLPFILPTIIAPEGYGITDQAVGAMERRNLAAIANLITHVAAQDLSNSPRDWFVRTPLKEYIRSDGVLFRDYIMDVASVEPLEAYFQADELFEATIEAKPIVITRSEIYGMLNILIKHTSDITAKKPRDPIALVLQELEGPPLEYDRSKTTVSLRLTNRLAELQATSGPEAAIKEDWVQAKRHVLAVLRVQTGRTLFDVLISRPEEVHEHMWLETVYRDMELEKVRAAKHSLPPTPVEREYQIESIRSLAFHEVKSRAIEFCMRLERAGKLSRSDHFQGLLVSIASDIRQKHHLRKMQRQTAAAMEQAYEDMSRKHKSFEEQIKSYHQFIDSSMASLQKGKKKPTFLSKQYFHQRAEAKSGRKAQFGSYKYTAHDLYQRGILLGINQLSPTQFPDVHIIMASNEVGVFSLEMSSTTVSLPGGSNTVMGREEVRMEDLLQAQFENELNLQMWNGMATFSINMLIHQINKKFYAT